MKRSVLLALLTLAASFYTVSLVQAQGNYPTDNDVNAIAKKLYCPVCPNTPLDVCETKACADWRQQIREQLADGWTEAQVIDYFVAQYGERVLAEPERSGFTSLVWILPVVALVLGLIVAVQVLRSWQVNRQLGDSGSTMVAEIDPVVRTRIEQELQEIA